MHGPVGRVQFVVLKTLRVLINPKLDEKNHVITCSVVYLSESFLQHYELPVFVNPDTASECKALCHALSGAFILIQLHGYELKCATSIQACNLPSLRAVAKDNPRVVAFSSFVEFLFCVHKRPVASTFVYILIIFFKSV